MERGSVTRSRNAGDSASMFYNRSSKRKSCDSQSRAPEQNRNCCIRHHRIGVEFSKNLNRSSRVLISRHVSL